QKAIMQKAKVKLARLQENLVNSKKSLANAQKNLFNSQTLQKNVDTNLNLARSRENGLRILVSNNAISRLDYLDALDKLNRAEAEITRAKNGVINSQNRVTEAEDKCTSLLKDIDAQLQEISQAEAAFESAVKQTQHLKSKRQSEILTQINRHKKELITVQGRLEQARENKEGEKIKAPVTGIVYKIKATQGPVQIGEELLSILPGGEELLLEVKVLNRDIGFIHQGMKAKVKVATFPFQEFGTIDGEVIKISPNAVLDKELGLVFLARIKLHKHHLMVRGRRIKLIPGMASSGEIVIRKKSVMTFITEPITRRFSEAFSTR
ncbi:MAG TPA: hemolysin D, partial [Richelia sp.]|nr:hemolysin D [Richelia sp.]